MPTDERFSKFLFGALLISSFFVSWGRWLALLLGVLFIASSIYGLCVSCKCKQFLNNKNQGEERMKSKLTICLIAIIGFTLATVAFAQESMKADNVEAQQDLVANGTADEVNTAEEVNAAMPEETTEAANETMNAEEPAAEKPAAPSAY
jgi:hypothetical protein